MSAYSTHDCVNLWWVNVVLLTFEWETEQSRGLCAYNRFFYFWRVRALQHCCAVPMAVARRTHSGQDVNLLFWCNVDTTTALFWSVFQRSHTEKSSFFKTSLFPCLLGTHFLQHIFMKVDPIQWHAGHVKLHRFSETVWFIIWRISRPTHERFPRKTTYWTVLTSGCKYWRHILLKQIKK